MLRIFAPLTFLLVLAARAWLHFSTPLVQGMNGGYYLVQARSLIEKTALAIPDLPLVFTLQALLAKVINLFTSLDLNESVMLAVKTVDSALPALGVIPVLLLGREWSKGDRVDWAIMAMIAVLVPAGAPALLMVGDFEKNSLGLMLLCSLAYAFHRWASAPSAASLVPAVVLLGLIGVCHIGVFGTTLIFVGSSVLAYAVAQGREGLRKALRLALIAAPVIALAAGLVFWKFDPSRVQKLVHAFSEPADYLGSMGGPGGGRGPAPTPGPGVAGPGMGGPGMGGPGFGGPGGPGGGPMIFPGISNAGWMAYAPMGAFLLAACSALIVAWWRRASVGVASVAVVTGAALTVIALTGPWVHGDKLMRFQLNATPLALLCLLFALLQIPHRWARGVPGIALLIAALIPTVMKLHEGPRPIITVEAHAELKSLASSVEDPAHTLIVARHGLEWWTAWTLHTHIAQAQALTADDWKTYRYVWFIEQKRGMGMMPFGPGGGMRPPGGDRDPRERGGPRGMPPGFTPGAPGMGGPGPRGGPGGMMGASIPNDAEVLHEGAFFKLAWVRYPPDFVTQREANPFDPLAGWP